MVKDLPFCFYFRKTLFTWAISLLDLQLVCNKIVLVLVGIILWFSENGEYGVIVENFVVLDHVLYCETVSV